MVVVFAAARRAGEQEQAGGLAEKICSALLAAAAIRDRERI